MESVALIKVESMIEMLNFTLKKIDGFNGFPHDKEHSSKTISDISDVLAYVSTESLISNASCGEEACVLQMMLATIHNNVNRLNGLMAYCERRPYWTTYIVPKKQNKKWKTRMDDLERDLMTLNLCISQATKMNTQDIKKDTKELKSSTQDIKVTVV